MGCGGINVCFIARRERKEKDVPGITIDLLPATEIDHLGVIIGKFAPPPLINRDVFYGRCTYRHVCFLSALSGCFFACFFAFLFFFWEKLKRKEQQLAGGQAECVCVYILLCWYRRGVAHRILPLPPTKIMLSELVFLSSSEARLDGNVHGGFKLNCNCNKKNRDFDQYRRRPSQKVDQRDLT